MSSRKASKPLPKFEIESPTTTTLTRLLGNDYQILHAIGEGAYGTVAAALHKPTGRQVAIKKILPFDHTLFCLRTLRELKLLKFFSETCVNENELMQTDLHRVIRTQHLTDDHCQYFVYQTLRALKSIHSAGIVHRDLKPANLLLNANCDLKVCDFGLARSVKTSVAGGKEVGIMTEYVATSGIAPPKSCCRSRCTPRYESLLLPDITLLITFVQAIDIWAVGCVLAELLTGDHFSLVATTAINLI
ncbi:Mitogen-activated protein [Salix suchowensis]|nr:Mitogen-activated protein [Salix suchowensis]